MSVRLWAATPSAITSASVGCDAPRRSTDSEAWVCCWRRKLAPMLAVNVFVQIRTAVQCPRIVLAYGAVAATPVPAMRCMLKNQLTSNPAKSGLTQNRSLR
jgi:hypothetical protein